jgi:vacuolar-type H+-ATPase subunit E/Vma4
MTDEGGMRSVFESLRTKARCEAASLIEQARADAERTTADAAVRAAARRLVEEARQDVEPRRESADRLAKARQQAAASVLRARHDLVDRVLLAAESRFAGGGAPLPAGCIRQLLEESLPYLADDDIVVRCRPESAAEAAVAVGGCARAEICIDEAMGAGVIVSARGGGAEVDNTVGCRIRQRRPELAALLVAAVGELP